VRKINKKAKESYMKENEKKKKSRPSNMGPDLGCGIITDPNGSYTGVPLDESEQPVQDADDL
jgi:hypothetical protein